MMNERLKNLKPEGYIFYEADLSGTSVLNESPSGDEFSTATLESNESALRNKDIYLPGFEFFTQP